MKLIKRLNLIFLGFILLVTVCLSGVFWFTNRGNIRNDVVTFNAQRKAPLVYQKNLTGKIKLGSVNGLAITERDIEDEIVEEEQIIKEVASQKSGALVFIGGELQQEGEIGIKLKKNLLAIADLKFGPVIFTGNLIKFKQEEKEVSDRIKGVKELLSASFQNKFNISFGRGDIFCGEKCINGWGEILFGKKIETEELLFAYSFKYNGTKVLLLEPGFFEKEQLSKIIWLEDSLKNNQQENLIVVSHNSIKGFGSDSSKGICAENCFEEGKNRIDELFEKYQVNLVVFGDKDNFIQQNKNGVTYVSSGNFQKSIESDDSEVLFSKIDFDEKQMMFSTYNNKLEKLAEFKIK